MTGRDWRTQLTQCVVFSLVFGWFKGRKDTDNVWLCFGFARYKDVFFLKWFVFPWTIQKRIWTRIGLDPLLRPTLNPCVSMVRVRLRQVEGWSRHRLAESPS